MFKIYFIFHYYKAKAQLWVSKVKGNDSWLGSTPNTLRR